MSLNQLSRREWTEAVEGFGLQQVPRELRDELGCCMHPSGLCRTWNLEGAFEGARTTLVKLAPHLAEFIGKVDDDVA